MSEFEEASGRSKNTNLWIGVICVVVVGGCLLVCAGLVAVGLVVPVVIQQRQAQREGVEQQAATNAAQQDEAKAADKADTKERAANETVEPPATKAGDESATDDTPANDDPKIEDEGIRGS